MFSAQVYGEETETGVVRRASRRNQLCIILSAHQGVFTRYPRSSVSQVLGIVMLGRTCYGDALLALPTPVYRLSL